jgi:hypothetical protein
VQEGARWVGSLLKLFSVPILKEEQRKSNNLFPVEWPESLITQENMFWGRSAVVHIYNPSYMGGVYRSIRV